MQLISQSETWRETSEFAELSKIEEKYHGKLVCLWLIKCCKKNLCDVICFYSININLHLNEICFCYTTFFHDVKIYFYSIKLNLYLIKYILIRPKNIYMFVVTRPFLLKNTDPKLFLARICKKLSKILLKTFIYFR